MTLPRALAALPLVAALAACSATHGSYPSLLPRPVEARGWAEPAQPAATPVAADPALDATIAQQRTALAAVDQRFAAKQGRAATLVQAARGDRAGGERWLAAQQSLGDLDVERADSSAIVATLEQAQLDRAAALAADYPPLEEAHRAAQAQLAAEAGRIGELSAALPGS